MTELPLRTFFSMVFTSFDKCLLMLLKNCPLKNESRWHSILHMEPTTAATVELFQWHKSIHRGIITPVPSQFCEIYLSGTEAPPIRCPFRRLHTRLQIISRSIVVRTPQSWTWTGHRMYSPEAGPSLRAVFFWVSLYFFGESLRCMVHQRF